MLPQGHGLPGTGLRHSSQPSCKSHDLTVHEDFPSKPSGPCSMPWLQRCSAMCSPLMQLRSLYVSWFLYQLHSLAAAAELDRGQHVEEFVAGAAQLNQAEGTARQVVTTVVRSISELQQGVKDVGFEQRDG